MSYFLCVDMGTSSAKIAIVSIKGEVKVTTNQSYQTYYPNSGWSEQNSEEWWQAVINGITVCLDNSKLNVKDIKCVGVAGQSWSNIAVDKNGNVLGNNPIWTDTRAKDICAEYIEKIGQENIFKVSGNPFMPGYQLPKILWLKENQPEIYRKTWQFMSSNGFIGYKFTGKSTLDYSQIYGLHNINMATATYDEKLTEQFSVDIEKLPEICQTTDIIGEVTKIAAEQTGLIRGTPVIAGGLDAACSTLGVGVYENGMVQEQGGQAGGMSIALDQLLIHPALIMSRHVLPDLFLLQGGTVGGGASFEWISDLFRPKYDNSNFNKKNYFIKLDKMAENISPGSEGLIFLPYMSGERSPIWDPNARGVFYGLDFNKADAHMIRSVMEGVAFSLRHNIEVAEEMDIHIAQYRATGGSANSPIWTQIKADVTSCEVVVPDSDDATVKGVAMLCGMALGDYKDLPDFINQTIKIKRTYSPNLANKQVYDHNFKIYKDLYLSLKNIMVESTRFFAE